MYNSSTIASLTEFISSYIEGQLLLTETQLIVCGDDDAESLFRCSERVCLHCDCSIVRRRTDSTLLVSNFLLLVELCVENENSGFVTSYFYYH